MSILRHPFSAAFVRVMILASALAALMSEARAQTYGDCGANCSDVALGKLAGCGKIAI
jgi:hypothetical protein